jgi:YggT family protein
MAVTDPPLEFTRKHFPLRLGGLDFSPLFLLIAIQLLRTSIKYSLLYLSGGGPAIGLFGVVALAILQLLKGLVWIIIAVMIARVIMSLINPSPYNPLVMAVYAISQPLLAPFRRTIPNGPGGLDLKAIIAIVVLYLIMNVLLTNLEHTIIVWLSGQVSIFPQVPAPSPGPSGSGSRLL